MTSDTTTKQGNEMNICISWSKKDQTGVVLSSGQPCMVRSDKSTILAFINSKKLIPKEFWDIDNAKLINEFNEDLMK